MTKTTEGMPQETDHQKPEPSSPFNLQQTAWDIQTLRTALYDEPHALPFPVFKAPVRITNMAFLHERMTGISFCGSAPQAPKIGPTQTFLMHSRISLKGSVGLLL